MTRTLDTVYVLGAGFSRDAGMPLQREILSSVRSLDLLVPPLDVQTKYFEAYALVQEFMSHFFELVAEPTLEDVFTFLDDSIARRQHCLGFKWKDLAEVHSSFVQLIVVCFLDRQARISELIWDWYRRVAAGILTQLGDPSDSVVLSLNWDCVAERALSAVVDSDSDTAIRCCPATTPLGRTREREVWSLDYRPGLALLKLHGSIDWFLCPECGSLLTGAALGEKELCRYAMGEVCPHCGAEAGGGRGALLPMILSPTYLKGLDQPRMSLIWHWAHIALRAAQQVVFVGYSLPGADFALRNLLKRSIGRDVPVSVVLTEGDDYHPNTPRALRSAFPAERYRRFFGGSERLRFHLEGLGRFFLDSE